MTSDASNLPEHVPAPLIGGRVAATFDDPVAASLRGFGPLGLLAILLIVLTSVFKPLSAILVLVWAWRSHTPVHLILLPVACDPHPATGTTDPMTFHPNSRCRSTRDPRAGDPHILGSGPAPITPCPNIPRTWRDGLRLDANHRRSLSYQDLSRGWTRRCYFSRGGCCHRRWFPSAAEQCLWT